jgi:hypothetical protein
MDLKNEDSCTVNLIGKFSSVKELPQPAPAFLKFVHRRDEAEH